MKRKKRLTGALGLLVAFVLFTAAVRLVDVRPIGPQGSSVGFANLNRWFHELTGEHMMLYVITDWLSLIPAGCVLGFALLGLWQWIKRKRILKVDRDILALGGFYLAVMAAYVLFEAFPINYRPVLIDGALEASYPSSTTMLSLCVMPTAAMLLQRRIAHARFRRWVCIAIAAFTAFMALARLLSGVHWLTDIVGGALLSAGLVMGYAAIK